MRPTESERPFSPFIHELADLIRTRHKAGDQPYTLLLGSSLSLTLEVRRAVCGSDNWEAFWTAMQRRSTTEGRALMAGPLANLNLAPGYRCLAQLVQAGYFSIILTANIDDALDNALRILTARECEVLCHGQASAQEIASALSQPSPRVKMVKLRGDINAYKLPLTPEGQFEFPAVLEEAVEALLSQDTILIGDILYDTDIQRCISKGDGALWVVVPEEPRPGSFLYNAKQARLKGEVITGPEAEFGSFFRTLAETLGPHKTIIPLNEPDPQEDPRGFIEWVEGEDRPDRVTPEVLSILAGPPDDPTRGSPGDIASKLVRWLIEYYPQRVAILARTNEQFLLAMAKSPEAMYALFDSLITNSFREVVILLANNLTPAVWKQLAASQGARDRLRNRLSEAEILSRDAPLSL